MAGFNALVVSHIVSSIRLSVRKFDALRLTEKMPYVAVGLATFLLLAAAFWAAGGILLFPEGPTPDPSAFDTLRNAGLAFYFGFGGSFGALVWLFWSIARASLDD